jgi:hypothetical protein
MFCFQTLDYITFSTLPPPHFFFIKRIIWIEVFVQLFTRCLVCCGVIMHAQLIRQITKGSLTEMVNNSPNINKTNNLLPKKDHDIRRRILLSSLFKGTNMWRLLSVFICDSMWSFWVEGNLESCYCLFIYCRWRSNYLEGIVESN